MTDQGRIHEFLRVRRNTEVHILGGLGGMPPRKIFEIWLPEMAFPAFWQDFIEKSYSSNLRFLYHILRFFKKNASALFK